MTVDELRADAVEAGGHGLHVNTYCPRCGGPLTHLESRPPEAGRRSIAVVTCPPCRDTYGIEVRLALIGRQPRRQPRPQPPQ